MNRLDLGRLTLVAGGFSLWVGLTDAVLLYLKASMTPFLVASGVVLCAVGLAVIGHELLSRRGVAEEADGGHGSRPARVGWLLVLPLCVAVIVGTDPLGAFAATRQIGSRTYSAGDVDVASYLEASSVGGGRPSLRMVDLNRAMTDEEQRAALSGRTIRLTGFVVGDDETPDEFLLTRFVIGCCAGDGLPAQARVRSGDTAIPEDDTWVEAAVVVDLDASPPDQTAAQPPVVDLIELERVDAPDQPYEYP